MRSAELGIALGESGNDRISLLEILEGMVEVGIFLPTLHLIMIISAKHILKELGTRTVCVTGGSQLGQC